jgi:hypothetical protein
MKFIFPRKHGEISQISIPEELKKDPNILGIDTILKVGDKVGLPPESFDYIGYVSAKGKTPEEAERNVDKALEDISIKIN